MKFRLPPLYTLLLFEAAGRHLNFKTAAQELSITPSAISHGIQALEDWLGSALFHRSGRTLALTPLRTPLLNFAHHGMIADPYCMQRNVAQALQEQGEQTGTSVSVSSGSAFRPPQFAKPRRMATSVPSRENSAGAWLLSMDTAIRGWRSRNLCRRGTRTRDAKTGAR